MIQMCLVRKSLKMCCLGVPPETGLGNIALKFTQSRSVQSCSRRASSSLNQPIKEFGMTRSFQEVVIEGTGLDTPVIALFYIHRCDTWMCRNIGEARIC